jgi:voltage-gated potassium channel Kch
MTSDFQVRIQLAAAEEMMRAQHIATQRAVEHAVAHGATVSSIQHDSIFVEWAEDPPAEVTFERILLRGKP